MNRQSLECSNATLLSFTFFILPSYFENLLWFVLYHIFSPKPKEAMFQSGWFVCIFDSYADVNHRVNISIIIVYSWKRPWVGLLSPINFPYPHIIRMLHWKKKHRRHLVVFCFIFVAKTTNLTTQTYFTAPGKTCAQLHRNTQWSSCSSPTATHIPTGVWYKKIQYIETLYTRSQSEISHSDNTWVRNDCLHWTVSGSVLQKHATPDDRSNNFLLFSRKKRSG